jgi:hypothetical protein
MSDKHPPEEVVESWATAPVEIPVLHVYPGSEQVHPDLVFPKVGDKPLIILLHPEMKLAPDFSEGSAIMQMAYCRPRPLVDPILLEKFLQLIGFVLETDAKFFSNEKIIVAGPEKILVANLDECETKTVLETPITYLWLHLVLQTATDWYTQTYRLSNSLIVVDDGLDITLSIFLTTLSSVVRMSTLSGLLKKYLSESLSFQARRVHPIAIDPIALRKLFHNSQVKTNLTVTVPSLEIMFRWLSAAELDGFRVKVPNIISVHFGLL